MQSNIEINSSWTNWGLLASLQIILNARLVSEFAFHIGCVMGDEFKFSQTFESLKIKY